MPFTRKVVELALLSKFWVFPIDLYGGKRGSEDHIKTYQANMTLQGAPDEIICRAFPLTLKGSSRRWFNNLPSGSIETFAKLGKSFLTHFIGTRRLRRLEAYFLTMKHKEHESLKDFMARLNQKKLLVDDPNEKVVHPTQSLHARVSAKSPNNHPRIHE